MLKDLHISHLVGNVTVRENYFHGDDVRSKTSRFSVGEMFFKPYESKKEAIFCARHTLIPLPFIMYGLSDPTSLIGVPLAALCFLTFGGVMFGLNKCVGDEASASWWLIFMEESFSGICQVVIDSFVFPLAISALITRSLSTGLQAANIYDYDAPVNTTLDISPA